MSLRYLLDEDMSPAVAEGLRLRGIDAVSVHDLGRANQGVPDTTWLEEATAEGGGQWSSCGDASIRART